MLRRLRVKDRESARETRESRGASDSVRMRVCDCVCVQMCVWMWDVRFNDGSFDDGVCVCVQI